MFVASEQTSPTIKHGFPGLPQMGTWFALIVQTKNKTDGITTAVTTE